MRPTLDRMCYPKREASVDGAETGVVEGQSLPQIKEEETHESIIEPV